MKVKLNISLSIAGLDVYGNKDQVIDVSHVPAEIVKQWLDSGMVEKV